MSYSRTIQKVSEAQQSKVQSNMTEKIHCDKRKTYCLAIGPDGLPINYDIVTVGVDGNPETLDYIPDGMRRNLVFLHPIDPTSREAIELYHFKNEVQPIEQNNELKSNAKAAPKAQAPKKIYPSSLKPFVF